MARNPIILPANVHLDFGLMGSVGGAAGVEHRPSGHANQPDTFRFAFRNSVAVSLMADIQVGLFAESDRALCDLQLIQFVTPRRFEVVYVGVGGGNTRVNWSGAIENTTFRDGHAAGGSDLTPANGDWMSLARKAADFRPNTRAGHFINQCIDAPGSNEPSWVVVQHDDPMFRGTKHFLWRLERFDEFLTIAVFIHPSGERQPIAMASWTCQHSYRFSWRKVGANPEVHTVVGGRSIIAQRTAPTTDPAALMPHVAKVRTPPPWILPAVNPQLTAAFAGSGVSGLTRTSSPINHPEAPADVFEVVP